MLLMAQVEQHTMWEEHFAEHCSTAWTCSPRFKLIDWFEHLQQIDFTKKCSISVIQNK